MHRGRIPGRGAAPRRSALAEAPDAQEQARTKAPGETLTLYEVMGKVLEQIEDMNRAGKREFEGDAATRGKFNKDILPGEEGETNTRQEVHLELSPDEQLYTSALVEEIAPTFGDHYEPMPPEMGHVVVPDVVAGNKVLGEAALFHCLFTDNW